LSNLYAHVQFIGLHIAYLVIFQLWCVLQMHRHLSIRKYGLACRTTARNIHVPTLLKHCLWVWCKFIFKAPH